MLDIIKDNFPLTLSVLVNITTILISFLISKSNNNKEVKIKGMELDHEFEIKLFMKKQEILEKFAKSYFDKENFNADEFNTIISNIFIYFDMTDEAYTESMVLAMTKPIAWLNDMSHARYYSLLRYLKEQL